MCWSCASFQLCIVRLNMVMCMVHVASSRIANKGKIDPPQEPTHNSQLTSNPHQQLLPGLDLGVVELIERFDLLDCKSVEFPGDVPQSIAGLNNVCCSALQIFGGDCFRRCDRCVCVAWLHPNVEPLAGADDITAQVVPFLDVGYADVVADGNRAEYVAASDFVNGRHQVDRTFVFSGQPRVEKGQSAEEGA